MRLFTSKFRWLCINLCSLKRKLDDATPLLRWKPCTAWSVVDPVSNKIKICIYINSYRRQNQFIWKLQERAFHDYHKKGCEGSWHCIIDVGFCFVLVVFCLFVRLGFLFLVYLFFVVVCLFVCLSFFFWGGGVLACVNLCCTSEPSDR